MRLLIALLVMFAVYSLQLNLYRKYWDRGLSVKLQFSKDVVSFGDKVELIEVIENDKPLALPILNVKFATSRSFIFEEEDNSNVSDRYYRNDIFSILGFQRLERRLSFETTGRGVFRINELQVSSKDLFLKHRFAHITENDTALTVLPKRIPPENYAEVNNLLMGDFEVNRWDNEDPFAFRGIRPYQSFDTMGSINWKATARMGEMMVNQYQATTESEVRIYLNLKPYMKSQADLLAEHSISIVSTIAAEYISHGIKVAFFTNGFDIDSEASVNPILTAGAGKQHLKSLDIMLARIDISKPASDMMDVLNNGFNDTDKNVTRIIVSTYRDDALYDFFSEQSMKKTVYWIIPERYGDPSALKYPGMYIWNI